MIRRAHDERGFTLIELLIAMVLLSLAVGMVATGIIHSLRSSSSARAGGVSDAATARVFSTMEGDVVNAETMGRAIGQVRDVSELAAGVQDGSEVRSTDPQTAGKLVDLDDVFEATGSKLTVQTDVVANGAGKVECITWEASAPAGQDFRLTRTVRSSCGGRTLEDPRVMLQVPAAATGTINAAPFQYVLRCNGATCGGSPVAGCGTWVANPATVTGTKRRWIVGVKVNLSNASVQGASAAQSHSSANFTLRSRDTNDYLAALGC